MSNTVHISTFTVGTLLYHIIRIFFRPLRIIIIISITYAKAKTVKKNNNKIYIVTISSPVVLKGRYIMVVSRRRRP